MTFADQAKKIRYRLKPETKAKEAAYSAERYRRLKADPDRHREATRQKVASNSRRYLEHQLADAGVTQDQMLDGRFLVAVMISAFMMAKEREDRHADLEARKERAKLERLHNRQKRLSVVRKSKPQMSKPEWNAYQRSRYAELSKNPEWQEKHRARVRKAARVFQARHRDRIKAESKQWRLDNPEKVKAWDKKRQPEKYKRLKNDPVLWDRHQSYQRTYVRQKRRTDINFRLSCTLRGRINAVLRGTSKSASTFALLGCTIEELRRSLAYQFKEGMTWDNYGNGDGRWNIDHRVPCAAYDLTDPDQQKLCFSYTNLQPMWFKENCSKNSRHNGEKAIRRTRPQPLTSA